MGAWDIKAAELPHWYLDLFQDAGGRIVLLPPRPMPTHWTASTAWYSSAAPMSMHVATAPHPIRPRTRHVSQGMSLKPCFT